MLIFIQIREISHLHSDKSQVLPHQIQQIVKVPAMMRRHRNAMRNLVDHVQLLDTDLINLVQQIDARDVNAIALDHIDQIVRGGVEAQRDVRIVNLVLGQNGLDRVQIQFGLGNGCGQIDAALVLAPVIDVRRFLVQANAEALQLVLEQFLVVQRLQDVQHHED